MTYGVMAMLLSYSVCQITAFGFGVLGNLTGATRARIKPEIATIAVKIHWN